jgi:quinol monooxygenase YgiN
MSISMRAEVRGMTPDQFEVLFATISDQLKAYPGFIAHISSPVPGGIQVYEVWESQEAHDRWAREVIAPVMQQAALTEPQPPFQYLPVAHFFTRNASE